MNPTYEELMEEYRQLADKKDSMDYSNRRAAGYRMTAILRLVNACICRKCGKTYDESKARSNWKGFCSAKCEHEMAKYLGWRKSSKESEYKVLKRHGEVGSQFIIRRPNAKVPYKGKIIGPGECAATVMDEEVPHSLLGQDTILHCPDCGHQTLQLIENTEPDSVGEYKECRTCAPCENMVYIVRTKGE